MWLLRPKSIPAVVELLVTVKNGTKQYLEQIPGFPSLTEIQKIVLISTAYIFRKTLCKSIANFVFLQLKSLKILYTY